MKSLILVAVVSVLFLEGCTTLMRPVKALPELGTENDNNVTILRNYNYIYAAVRFWPIVDGQEVSGLFPKQHISFKLPPGKHSVGVRCGWGEDQLEVEIKENELHFYKISLNLLGILNPFVCAEIEEIPKTEAINRLQKSTRIKTGYLSDCDRRSVLYETKPDYTCYSYAFP